MEGVADDAPSKERIRYACAHWRRRYTCGRAIMGVLLSYTLVPTLHITHTPKLLPTHNARTHRAPAGAVGVVQKASRQ